MKCTTRVASLLPQILISLAIVCAPVDSAATTVATPTFSPVAGSYTGTQSVTISDATSGATIYYTTNGTTPTSSSTKYTAAISVSTSETIKAIAELSGDTNSAVASAAYTITVPTPTFSPVAGSYTGTQSVTISDATSGATIYYTTNGTTPTSSSTKYTAAISVSTSETIKAIAELSGDTNSAVASAAYTITVPTPTFSPAAGSYTGTQSVTISYATSGATCYYTLTAGTTGTTPTTSSTKYTSAISVTATSVLEALCTYSGDTNSAVATAKYTITAPVVATPTFSPSAGAYVGTQSVTINDTTSGATIYYTTNGTTPTSSSTKYTAAISVSTSETIEAIAELSGDTNSAVASAAYTITVPTPTFSPVAGSYTGTQSVTISDATSGATIYYTTNGSTPTSSSTKYTAAISVSTSETIKAIAELSGDTNSAVASAAYTITVPTPTFSPGAGTYTSSQSVTISDATSGATCYYTLTAGTTGTTPTTSSTKYTSAISVTATSVLEALCTFTGDTNSAVATAQYTITPTVATPTFSPVAGAYVGTQSVTINDATSGATIYYTTDGSTPTSSSTKYTAAISVSTSKTIKAIAELSGDTNSAVASAAYTITVPTPTFSPGAGTYTSSQSVTISDVTSGATCYYTLTAGTTGTTPTTSSTKYTSAISVTATSVLEALCTFTGDTNSAVATAQYTITQPSAPTPTFSPAAGNYATAQNVIISDSDSAATVYYTTDGTTPTTSSSEYVSGSPIYVGSNQTLKAIAVDPAYANSPVATAVYTIQAATPTFSPVAGSYVGTQTVTISDATSGNAKIYYTTNGTTPTTSSTKYSTAITVSSSETIKAIATANGYSTSPVGTAAYTITSVPATPTFSPVAGSYPGAQLVTISDLSLNATIYYTITSGTTGTTPTTSSSVYTGGAITVSTTETVEAIAVVTGYTSSPVATATYTLPAIVASTTALTLTSGGSPVTTVASGSAVTLTATVASGTKMITTGTVNFCDATATHCTDIHLLGTAQLTSAGTATINLRPGVGSHSYKAIFVGTSSYSTSSSSTDQLSVTGIYSTTTTIEWGSGTAGNYTLGTQVMGMGNNTVAPTGTVSILDTSNSNAVLGTGSLSGSNAAHTFTNVSNVSFPITEGVAPNVFVVGDFNGDGKPDVAVVSLANSSVEIFLGNGDGTFTQAVNSPVMLSIYPSFIVAGDFNGDGKLDLVAFESSGDATILLGNGDGTFTIGSSINYGSYFEATAAAVGDFNGDGKLDLAVTNYYEGTVTILLGNGDGTFTPAGNSPATVAYAQFIAVGDFNGDGKPDLAVLGGGSLTILLGNGDGTFTQASGSPVTVGYENNSIAVGDFNGDGKQDLAVTGFYYPWVFILLGNGDGTFIAAANAYVGNGPSSVAVGDFNRDGIPDLAVANNYDNTVTYLAGNGNGTFSSIGSVLVNNAPTGTGGEINIYGPESVAVGDFNGDGTPDLAVVNYTSTNSNSTSTLTILQTSAGEIANATITGIVPVGTGTHNVEASYGGDSNFTGSTSATTPLTTVVDVISGVSPISGPAGTLVTITGMGFGSAQGSSSLTVGGINAAATAGEWSNTQIQAQIPNGTGPGPQSVVVTIGGLSGQSATFTVTPGITGITPSSGLPGTVVNITGTNFGTTTGMVTFNGTSATITNWTNTSIQTSVPMGTTTGNVVVSAAGVASNGVSFTVTPSITSLSVTSGAVNTPVTITGTSFGTTTGTVTFNGTSATITNWTNTSIQTSVPTGATTGNVVVTAGSVASNGVAFTVLTVTLASSANPSSYGGSVTFTATFSISGPTGSVTVMDSGTQIGTGTITGTTATYTTSSLAIGTHSITASWPGNSTYPPITSSPVLQKVQNTPAVYSWPWASDITFGQTLASSQLIGGSAAVSGTFAWTAPGTIPSVGAPSESVTFTPSDTTDYSSATGSVAVTVDPIESPASSSNVTYTYDNLGRVYQAQYSTSSGTITVTYSYDSAGNRTSVVTQ